MGSNKASWWRQLRGRGAEDEAGVATLSVPATASPPAVGAAEEAARRFAQNSSENLFRGVFDSAEAATLSAPATRPLGYDNPESAALYFGRMQHELYDYPAMFWLRRSLDAGLRSVFDVGGHVGIKFYAFRAPVALPDDLRWLVCDVPAVIERGAKVAARRGVDPWLSFTSDYQRLDGTDILFASGALQYLPFSLDEWLGGLARPPQRLIINTTAVHPEREYYTLNSIGTAFCPYRVVAEPRFLDSLAALGYRLVDRWTNPGKTLMLETHPDLSLGHYSGYYFEREAT